MKSPSFPLADQGEVEAFLADPATHGLGAEPVERIDTHGAMVFLAGDRAYKIKRAVRFPYMDFSTLELRRRMCLREVELNRRTAPELYLGVAAITREADGALALAGDGEPIEWAVVMRRFPQDALCDRLAQAGRLTADLARALADEVARFHEAAPPLHGADAAGGGAPGMRAVVEENVAELRAQSDVFPAGEVDDFAEAANTALSRLAPLLDARLAAGMVRRCHGDLFLRNICVIDGRPRLFDAIEFNDVMACIDVLYDLAFLLMDLDHRRLRPLANLVLNRYVQRRGDIPGLEAMALFLSTRAAVRAKVNVSIADSQPDPAAARRYRAEAVEYFRAARAYLVSKAPCLVAIGGLSGTGKTELARRLAADLGASPGALHLRSDVLRKARHGIDELDRLPDTAYSAAESARIYGDLAAQARSALAAGSAVVADAVYAAPAERAAIEAIAQERGVPFIGLWLEAPAAELLRRVARRRGDASDATPAVVRKQLTYDIGTLTWQRLDAMGSAESVAAAARALTIDYASTA